VKRVSSFLTLLSLVFLAYVVGQFSAWTHAFPFEPHFRKSFVGLQAFWDQYSRLGDDYISDVWMPVSMRRDSAGERTSRSYARYGSKADIQRRVESGPLTGAKRTSNVRFQGPTQFLAGNVCFRG
jgi:hypothetical protein